MQPLLESAGIGDRDGAKAKKMPDLLAAIPLAASPLQVIVELGRRGDRQLLADEGQDHAGNLFVIPGKSAIELEKFHQHRKAKTAPVNPGSKEFALHRMDRPVLDQLVFVPASFHRAALRVRPKGTIVASPGWMRVGKWLGRGS